MFPSVVMLKIRAIQLDTAYQELQSWKAHIGDTEAFTQLHRCALNVDT